MFKGIFVDQTMPRKRRSIFDKGDEETHAKRSRNSSLGNRQTKLDEFNQKRCIKWFKQYATQEDSDLIGPEGVEQFCKDIEVDPENIVMLVIAWKMNAKNMGYFTLQEWLRGCIEMQCDTAAKLRNRISFLKDLLQDSTVFRNVYRYAYDFSREKNQRSMDIEIAKPLLRLLLNNNWKLYPAFQQFLEQCRYKVINKDQWFNILEFSKIDNLDFSKYDLDGAWPVLLDEFVDWCKNTCNVNGSL